MVSVLYMPRYAEKNNKTYRHVSYIEKSCCKLYIRRNLPTFLKYCISIVSNIITGVIRPQSKKCYGKSLLYMPGYSQKNDNNSRHVSYIEKSCCKLYIIEEICLRPENSIYILFQILLLQKLGINKISVMVKVFSISLGIYRKLLTIIYINLSGKICNKHDVYYLSPMIKNHANCTISKREVVFVSCQ